ncbi:9687_t:CDS:2 [Entrophospora sp. SA101]|nr:237_t:CDS:2 [Entrophospora sp. SA101]CAJ0835034.1 9687_t:CDS:2 [Entrophospora sp. SA101]CAJ0884078.1 7833_t:CDS:2 [Entrophospora sp. SA101]CAJ0922633.1 10816_t:CDS:2 [Entrophospora sp. SA101]
MNFLRRTLFKSSSCYNFLNGKANNIQNSFQLGFHTSPESPIPEQILRTSLSYINQYGWTINTLSQGAKSLGYSSVAHGLFPRGGVELIDFFLEDSRQKMICEIKDKVNEEGLKIPQKIRLACITRLNLTKPYIKKWPEALAIMSQPNNFYMSFLHLAKLVDDIWYLAGDKSADMNWYSKRTTLAMIYSTTGTLYMTQDNSPDFMGTYQFLDRRLQDTATFGKSVADVKAYLSFVGRSLNGVLESKRIL